MNIRQFKSWFLDAYGESFVTDGLTNVNSAGANFDGDSSFGDWSNISYLGMVNYNYLGKYIADAHIPSGRFITFPSRIARFGNFWAIGGAWNMSQENFMSGVTFVDNLRLRASYGISGNSGVSVNSYQSLLAFNTDYAGARCKLSQSGYGNPIILHGRRTKTMISVSISAVLNSRIDGQISYYNKETYDLLQSVPLTQTSGFSSVNEECWNNG